MRNKIVIVGAGFSGLVTAYYLKKLGWNIEIYEKSERAGGLIQTEETPMGLAESGANGILNNIVIEALFSDLGVVMLGARKEGRKRFIYRLHPRQWPLSWSESRHLIMDFLPRFLFWRRSLKPRPMETLIQWGERTMGPEPTQYLLSPAFQGIYAGDVSRLSATLVLGKFFLRNHFRRPRVKGIISPAKGMGQLIEHLRLYLEKQGAVFHFGRSFDWKEVKKETPVIICTSADQAAEILRPKLAELAQALEKVEMLPLVSVTLFYDKKPNAFQGFGCLFPRSEGFDALGVLYNNSIFEGRSSMNSETWIFGGAHKKDVCLWDDSYILSKIQVERMKMLGYRTQPVGHRIYRWPQAIPHYTTDLEQLQADLGRPHHDNIHLMGNYLGEIGLGSIAERAKGLAEQLGMPENSQS